MVRFLYRPTGVATKSNRTNTSARADATDRSHVLLESSHQTPILVERFAKFEPCKLFDDVLVRARQVMLGSPPFAIEPRDL